QLFAALAGVGELQRPPANHGVSPGSPARIAGAGCAACRNTMAVCPTRLPTAMALNPYDLFDVRSLLSEEERAVQDTVARFTDERVIPIIGDAFDQGRFPKELVPEIASMGLLGSSLPEKYGC